MSKLLLIAEHDNQTLKNVNYHVLTAAHQLADEIDVLIIGFNCQTVINAAQLLPHVKRVLVAEHDVYQHQLAENCSRLVAELGKDYAYILTGATTFGKNLLPRAAALLKTSMLSDVMQIINADTFVRPIYAGNAIATLQMSAPIKLLTIRATNFAAVQPLTQATTDIEKIDKVIENNKSHFISQQLTKSSRPELSTARVIISGGRGLKSAENFRLLEEIADCLNGAVGASRAAVDAGYAPNDYQVGQTGKVVAPDLYIAVGISGAIQHLAGMKDSKIIVAINNDPDAPIFTIADYGLVGDLFAILAELKQQLTKVKATC